MTTDSRSIEITQAQLTVSDRVRLFFIRPRGDSPFRSLWINLVLIIACVIAIYPALRVMTISLRPNDQVFSTSLDIIPQDATLQNYSRLFTEKNFLVWIWNSLLV